MSLIPTLQDYTDLDFDALRFRLRNLIQSVFPEWTEFAVANFGNILVELFAHTGDILTFYQDGQARNTRITTATQRKALIGLVKLIGFAPSTATAATADVVITLPVVPAGDVVFQAGETIKTQEVTNPIVYQLLDTVTIVAGSNPATVTVSTENSTSFTEDYISTGLPNQSIQLGQFPYIDSTAVVTDGNGSFSEVDDFLDSKPSDKDFTIQVDQNDVATLSFGNGVDGAIPIGTITVTYKTGGGSAGRVESGALSVFGATTRFDSIGNAVSPTCTNPSTSSGGTDRQTVAQIQERAPATVRVQNRTVAKEDYEINALRLPAVARALMLTSNQDTTIGENQGQLYIVPVGGGTASTDLLSQVFTQVTVTYPNTITFDVEVLSAAYLVINVQVTVFFKAGAVKANVAAAIRANLATWFTPQNTDGTANEDVDFGANIVDFSVELSDIFDVVKSTSGVRKIGANDQAFLLNGLHGDVALLPRQFPKLGTVTIVDGDTEDTL